MAWQKLPTNFKDAAWEGDRKFNMTNNSDGTVSFSDVTEYTQIAGAYIGAENINATNGAINRLMEIFEEGYRLNEPTDVSLKNADSGVFISWTDPENVVDNSMLMVQWAGTIVVRKEISAPLSIDDGVVVVDEKIRNQYSINGCLDAGLVNGKTYYYGIFPYSAEGKYTTSFITMFSPSPIDLSTPVINSVAYNNGTAVISYTNYNDPANSRLVWKRGSAPRNYTDGNIIDNLSGSSMIIDGININSDYYFVIYAISASSTLKSNMELLTNSSGERLNVTLTTSSTLSYKDTAEITIFVTDLTDNAYNKTGVITGIGTYSFGAIPIGHDVRVSIGRLPYTDMVEPVEYTTTSQSTKTVTINIPFGNISLEDSTWAEINEACEMRIANQIWQVGDTKDIVIDNTTYTLAIMDFNHDWLASDNTKTAAMTLGFLTPYNNRRYAVLNYPWPNYDFYRMLNTTVYNQLKNVLGNIIKPVEKKYELDGIMNISVDNVFVGSIREVTNSWSAEGEYYPAFDLQDVLSLIPYNNIQNTTYSTRSYLTKSSKIGVPYYWIHYGSKYSISYNNSTDLFGEYYILPMFCI